MTRGSAIWVTRTAVFTALLVATQIFTAPLGQFVTGSLVNMILIVSVMTCGLASGLTVSLLSPVFAKLIGIGPLWAIVPFIMAGNALFVIIWHYMGNMKFASKYAVRIAALVSAAACKFLLLYISIARVVVPLFLGLPEAQARAVSGIFSLPQLVNPLIGGAVALIVLPLIERAISPKLK